MKGTVIKWMKRAIITVLAVLGLSLTGLHLMNFGLSEKKIAQRFRSAGVTYTGHQQHGLVWAESGNPTGPLLLFIHGSPGSWDAFIAYMCDPDLVSRFHMISVTRPGYAGRTRGRAVPSLADQVEAVSRVIPPGSSATLVGHSLGAPIAARLAMDFPEKVSRLVLLSASVHPGLEKVTWYQHVANWPGISWMLPGIVKVCNRELIPLKNELEKLEPRWQEIQNPVTAIHGTEDRLVPVENINYLRQNIPSGQLRIRLLPDADHFIPWTHFGEIKESLLKHL